MKHLWLLFFGCGLLAASPVWAKPWTVDYANSHVTFTGTQGDATFDGGFRVFAVTIDFDPDHPETGKIAATINMASAFAGSSDRDGALPKAEWFDTAKFPQAQFTSTGIQWDRHPANPVLRENIACYQVQGNLAIKGVTRPVTMPFCIVPEGDHTRAKGSVTLMRNDFNIGQGQWASDSFVKYNVDVTVDIAAR